MVISLEQSADLHMAQLMSLPLTVSCFSKIQIGFTFLVPAHPVSPGQRAVKRVCVCVLLVLTSAMSEEDAKYLQMTFFENFCISSTIYLSNCITLCLKI